MNITPPLKTRLKHLVSDTIIMFLFAIFFIIGLLPKVRRFLLSKIQPW